ncbi:hypothetical protein [Consotaella salsifontis]|uniref:Uncharacterized protein n=1 Tax=Consotaella salsifontis TaxID=1365950 RepID=A0A1T4T6S1_9HYPH|nr:hypothetical protein [Consotaella salsifontis]SKA36185.1 hypothetical protein SAMN05428963_12040 [Consotaella salsifontis]
MSDTSPEFRSKSQRDRDMAFESNFQALNLPAVAAASHPCCKQQNDAGRYYEHVELGAQSGDLD